jgi:hypothetical protein
MRNKLTSHHFEGLRSFQKLSADVTGTRCRLFCPQKIGAVQVLDSVLLEEFRGEGAAVTSVIAQMDHFLSPCMAFIPYHTLLPYNNLCDQF